jgi:hypothetical protein
VQRLLRRVGLATRRARVTVLEQQVAPAAGLLTDRTRRALWLSGHLLHWQSQGVGQVSGKVWQITACDAASCEG